MTLADAFQSIMESATRDAMKRPSMRGYFKRGELSTATGTEGDCTFELIGRDNDGTSGDPTPYVKFDYDASVKSFTLHTGSTAINLTGELLGELVADDWETGKAEDYEQARDGAGGEDW